MDLTEMKGVLFRTNDEHIRSAVIGFGILTTLAWVLHKQVYALLNTTVTVLPYGAFTVVSWLFVLGMIGLTGVLSYYRFGLVPCILAETVVCTAYLYPASSLNAIVGQSPLLEALVLAVPWGVILGSVGFAFGEVVRRAEK